MSPIEIPSHKHLIDRLAFFAGIVSGIALIPQVWLTLSTGTTAGVSFLTFFIIAVNSLVWLLYALHRGLIALGISSLLNFLTSLAMIGAYLWFTFFV